MIEIKSVSGTVLYSSETHAVLSACLVEAVGKGANLCGANLCGADLRSADLRSADLRSANLRSADLYGANLCGADLCSADLRSANLCSADLYGAYLCGADLYGANLCGANLCSADLRGADLRSANLSSADLRSANLCSADLYGAYLKDVKYLHYSILPEGDLIGYKKIKGDKIIKLLIPAKAKRVNFIGSRKCRAEYVKVLDGSGESLHCNGDAQIVKYTKGKITRCVHKFNDDPRLECESGIHFFITKIEAEQFNV